MGQHHFDQMYRDALEVDRRAFMVALRMREERDRRNSDEQPILADVSFEAAMEISRGMTCLWDRYVGQLKELHAANRIRIFGRDMRTGRLVQVEDVRALEDTWGELSQEQLLGAMMQAIRV